MASGKRPKTKQRENDSESHEDSQKPAKWYRWPWFQRKSKYKAVDTNGGDSAPIQATGNTINMLDTTGTSNPNTQVSTTDQASAVAVDKGSANDVTRKQGGRSLWGEAYKKLKSEMHDLMDKYERLLTNEMNQGSGKDI
jgi:hypothetical protein